jgi:Fic family protein
MKKEDPHESSEVINEYKCQKLIRDWTEEPETPSIQAISLLHRQLMTGSKSYAKKGIVPLAPGAFRITDVKLDQQPENFYVRGLDVSPTIRRYGHELDTFLETSHNNTQPDIEKLIREGAKFYYAFERIHPFLDGNGRTGRMVLKRIFTGGGLRDLIFISNLGKSRKEHIEVMEAIDRSGNIGFLEVYLLKMLSLRYLNQNDENILKEIDRIKKEKIKQIRRQDHKYPLEKIWEGFAKLDLA